MATQAPGDLLQAAEHWCAQNGAPLKGGAAFSAYLEAIRSEALRLNEDPNFPFLDPIVEHLPDMVFMKDAADLRFQQINRAGEALLGYPREALIGKNDFDLFPTDQARQFTEADRRVLATGQLLDISEETIQTRDGERTLHTKKIPIRNLQGQTTHLLGISEDITEKKRSDEERLLLIEERAARAAAEQASLDWSLLAQVSSQLAASLDLASSLSQVVRLLTPRLGDWAVIELQSDSGHPLFNAVHHREPAMQDTLHALQAHALRPAGFPWVKLPSDGAPLLVGEISDELMSKAAADPEHRRQLDALRPRAAVLSPLVARGRVVGFLTVARTAPQGSYELPEQALMHDLADRLALAVDNVRLHEEARQAIRARDEFLAVAAHELKTPLTTLQLHLQKLLRNERAEGRAVDSAPSQALLRAERQVQRLSALVNDLLDITRLSAERVALQPETFDLCALVSELTDRMGDVISKSQSVLSVQANHPVVGHWDRLRLSQVVTNLLSNALKYGAGGPIEVKVENGEHGAALSVRDHGIGISAEDHLRIFGPFQRAVSERHYGGLGLGLWIVHQIVSAHEGKISVQSQLGQGATFIVQLPLGTAPA